MKWYCIQSDVPWHMTRWRFSRADVSIFFLHRHHYMNPPSVGGYPMHPMPVMSAFINFFHLILRIRLCSIYSLH